MPTNDNGNDRRNTANIGGGVHRNNNNNNNNNNNINNNNTKTHSKINTNDIIKYTIQLANKRTKTPHTHNTCEQRH